MWRFTRLLAVAVLLCGVAVSSHAADDYVHDMLIEVQIRSATDVYDLEDIGVEPVHRDGGRFLLNATPEQRDELERRGYAVNVLIEDTVAYQRELLKAPGYDHYITHAELLDEMDSMAAANPDIMSVETAGTSVNGRDIILVKISDNVATNEVEPEVYFAGNIHGDELSAMEVAVNLIYHLVDNYGTDPDITALVDSREVFVNPMVNPDGRENGSRTNAHGVDLNRDAGYMWDGDGGSDAPFGEPETQTIRAILEAHHFTFATSYHSGTLFFSYPWSYTYDSTPEAAVFEVLGAGYTAVNGYPVNQGSSGMYRMSGSTKDVYYGTYGTFGWSIEVSYAKTPDYEDIPGICDDNIGGQLYLIDAAGQGIGGVVTGSDTDAPLPARIFVDGAWLAYSDEQIGDFHRFLPPGDYDVTVCAQGYQCETHQDVSVTAGAQTNLDTVLDPMASPVMHGWRFACSDMPNGDDATPEAWRTLGPPDGGYLSIGNGGYVVIDMGPAGAIEDVTGTDVTVYEGDSSAEGATVYASNTWNGPWSSIGSCTGTCSLDIAGAGLQSARYFKIEDDGKGALDGYDLDAIGTATQVEANFTATPVVGEPPLIVEFSSICVGNVQSYVWDFGDGGSSTLSHPTHTYQGEGTYTVSLTVTGAYGSDTETKPDYVTVQITTPAAAFSAFPTSGAPPLTVQFTDESQGIITDCLWGFGDGETSTADNPSYTYVHPGRYSVALTVSGPEGQDTAVKEEYIIVTMPGGDDDDDDTGDDDDDSTGDDDTSDDDDGDSFNGDDDDDDDGDGCGV